MHRIGKRALNVFIKLSRALAGDIYRIIIATVHAKMLTIPHDGSIHFFKITFRDSLKSEEKKRRRRIL